MRRSINRHIKNAFLYIILWLAGCIVGGVIIMVWNRADRDDRVAVFDNIPASELRDNPSNNIVNELLLSAHEFNIYGKSSIIGLNRHGEAADANAIIQQIRMNPENAYREILHDKIEKLKTAKTDDNDFSIKPVPK